MSQLCSCSSIFFATFISQPKAHEQRPREERSRGYLTASAENGCPLCASFLEHFLEDIEGDDLTEYGIYWCSASTDYYQSQIPNELLRISSRSPYSKRGHQELTIREVNENWDENAPPRTNFEQIQDWIEECVSNHTECRLESASFTPTRLIDLRCTNGLRIISTRENLDLSSLIKYIALSYCWGPSMPESTKTTTKNIKPRGSCFQMLDLPRTLQDAIEITRKLGIRYIWIDVLCILQDSNIDWERESAQMTLVYGHAYCTLAASAAPDVGTGFPRTLDSAPLRRQQVLFSFSHDTKAVRRKFIAIKPPESPYITITPPETPADGNSEYAPLDGRGWAFQEHHLSKRVVQFFNTFLKWKFRRYECSNVAPREALKFPEQITVESQPQTISQDRWPPLVSDYSSRDLTLKSDKLTALAGLASAVKGHNNDKYRAGLWLPNGEAGRNNLIEQLCWNVIKPYHHRPVKYRAPSWSWAAIDGRVRFRFQTSELSKGAGSALVIEASTFRATSDPYGSVTGGILIIGGPLGRIRCKLNGSANVQFFNFYGLNSSPSIGSLSLDVLDEGSDFKHQSEFGPDELFCLRLTSLRRYKRGTNDEVLNEENSLDMDVRRRVWEKISRDGDRGLAVGLVLVKDHTKPGSYRRIGLALNVEERLFKGCPWQPVRIV